MLEHLSIRNIVLIESLDLDFADGLTVLTGETGAGKSILLDALTLALGERADSNLIRIDAPFASVTATFGHMSPHTLACMTQAGFACTDNHVVLRRVVNRDKSSRAFLNDQPITVQFLRTLSHHLLDIHGQFDALSSPTDYRHALDGFITDKTLSVQVNQAYEEWQKANTAVSDHMALSSQGMAQLPFWKQAINEIEALGYKEGELETLEQQRSQMGHQGKIVEGLQDIAQSLDTKGIPALSEVSRILTKLAALVPSFASVSQQFESAYTEINDIHETLHRQRQAVEQSAHSLEAIESRLFAIRSLGRKYHVLESQLPEMLEDFRHKVTALENDAATLNTLQRHVEETRRIYVQATEKLTQARIQGAAQIQSLVAQELPDLRLPEARFTIQINPLPESKWGDHGVDEVLFMIQTNAGSSPGAIHTIASGGERSRLYLALKLALAHANPHMSFVFDEVDSGIGGATASAVGERLKRLATHGQVLVITHSPQVAAQGHTHWHITKATQNGTTQTQALRLNHAQRQEEIARMLSGSDVTEQARAAAGELMKLAG